MKDIKIFLKKMKKKSNKNLTEDKKQKLIEYRKNYPKMRKNTLL